MVKKLLKFAPVLIIGLFLLMYWELELKNASMPIFHESSYSDGSFTLTDGNIREILISTVRSDINLIPQDGYVTLNICNKNSEIVFSDIFPVEEITDSYSLLASFTKDSPLKLNSEDTYYFEIESDYNSTNNVPPLEELFRCNFVEFDGSYGSIYLIMSLVILVIVSLLIVFTPLIQKPENIFLCAVISVSILYGIVFPPLNVADEELHYMESYKISNTLLGTNPDSEGYPMMRSTDRNCLNYLNNVGTISGWYYNDESVFIKDSAYVSAKQNISVSTNGKYSYIPGALGISLGRLLHLNGHITMTLGRLFNLALSILICFFAIKLIPYGKWFMVLLGLLPECVMLFNSYSYDGLNIALCMLIVGYFLYLYQKESICIKQLLTFFVLIILMIPIKMVYVFFLALLFFLPRHKLSVSNKTLAGAGIVATVGIVGFIALNWRLIYIHLIMSGGDKAQYSLSYMLSNMGTTVSMYERTLVMKINDYFHQSFGQVIGQSRDSHLLEFYNIPVILVVVIVILMIISLEDTSANPLSVTKRVLSAVLSILSVVSILTVLLIAATAMDSYLIDGIQGRYFVPLYALIPVIVKNNSISIKSDKKTYITHGMMYVNIAFILFAYLYYARIFFS